MTTPHSIVADGGGVTRILGPNLITEIKEAVQADGDCLSCGRPLGTQVPVRLDVNQVHFVTMVYTRHAPCPPAARRGPGHLSTPSATHRLLSTRLPGATDAFGNHTDPLPLLIINPQCDVFPVFHTNLDDPTQSLLQPYEDIGFEPFSNLRLDRPTPQKCALALHGPAQTVTVLDLSYDYAGDPALSHQITAIGGLLTVITYRHHTREIATNKQAFVDLLQDPYGPRCAWIHAQ